MTLKTTVNWMTIRKARPVAVQSTEPSKLREERPGTLRLDTHFNNS